MFDQVKGFGIGWGVLLRKIEMYLALGNSKCNGSEV